MLLLDEPFGALDAKVRKELRRWLRALHSEINVTSVFVTHDQEEALEVADRVVVLNNGHIEQIGSPEEVYDRPASAFVHDFIGEAISLPVEVRGREVWFGHRVLPLEAQATPSGPARLFVRPFDMSMVASNEGALTGVVKLVKGFGPHLRVEIECQQDRGEPIALEIQTGRGARVEAGQTIGLRPERYRIFPQPDEQAPASAVSPESPLPA